MNPPDVFRNLWPQYRWNTKAGAWVEDKKPLTDGMKEVPWPNTTRAVRDDAAKRRRLRGAWMGLLAAATQLDSKWPNERRFAHKELKRLAARLKALGVEPMPGDTDVEA